MSNCMLLSRDACRLGSRHDAQYAATRHNGPVILDLVDLGTQTRDSILALRPKWSLGKDRVPGHPHRPMDFPEIHGMLPGPAKARSGSGAVFFYVPAWERSSQAGRQRDHPTEKGTEHKKKKEILKTMLAEPR